ncbi:holo-[acyl-carrier-protein] synthase [candidate division KSB1 bacterium]|nr:holo-[acyl-carrier-protein] synthase [candidate division KSB1 bacterium]NIR73393.1 holo-[acyl-carrier-protein] synthase [candidate division KSB1 bacterium]NIS28392.1 holo-[acyl-carrier-protein] synthase [candidate division KSB1 bacterium]NIT75273.1 holo-[acyl-carrier-protein] synthase [candidate division KSB1 bacterium]NIU29120.1 holo-[acyl-carrier-protein] synthase [candidate division KSB1 bacterium]
MFKDLGVDLVDVHRIEKIIEKWGRRFLERIFTQNEIHRCNKRVTAAECFAARFAAKEALAKALGHGWCQHFSWTDVEVVNQESGKPHISVDGKTKELVKNKRIVLSLSHTETHAVAVVAVEDGNDS